ncbi:MAG: dephospho-CoA kinase [Myxococcota bacterium]
MKVVGLTGGIGSGKSTVAKMFAARGAVVIDADRLAREAVASGSEGLKAIVDRFGADYLTADGELDRRKLGKYVFGDRQALADLNAIVHPEVARRLADRAQAAAAAGAELVVYDVPLLFENKLNTIYKPVIVVNVDPDVQRARVAARDNLTKQEIEDRIAAQIPLAQKATDADYVVDNNGSLADTKRQVDEIFAALSIDRAAAVAEVPAS